jgi:hypothetical protein
MSGVYHGATTGLPGAGLQGFANTLQCLGAQKNRGGRKAAPNV